MPDAARRFGQPPAGKVFRPPEPAHRGLYDGRWERYSKRFRRRHPLCARCTVYGRTGPAEVVDHVVPHRGDYDLFWAETNLCALCKQCHDILTYICDGAFGRPTLPKPYFMRGEKDTPEMLAAMANLKGGVR